MATIISTMLRAAARNPEEPLNILTFPTHERIESYIARTNHNFWSFRGPGIKDWNKVFAPVPSNYILMDPSKGEGQIPDDVIFDLVLSQSKAGQFQIAERFSKGLHIPMIHLEHTEPHPDWEPGHIQRLKRMKATTTVFISEYSRQRWQYTAEEGQIIHHGIDTDLFKPDPQVWPQPILLSVVNDWVNRDWCCGFKLWKEATEDLPCFVVGDTPGLSRPATTTDELVWRYQTARIFINTSLYSPIPTALLEAMACGCAVVTTNTGMISEVVQHEDNGFCVPPTPAMVRKACEILLNNHELCVKLGQRARVTIEKQFGLQPFIDNWNSVFYDTASKSYDK